MITLLNNWDLLDGCEIFNGIKNKDFPHLFNCLNYYIKEYKKGDTIYNNNIMIDDIGIILNGQVQMLKEDYFGNKTILTIIGEKEVFAETFASLLESTSTVSFTASKDSMVLFLPFKKVLRSCEYNCNYHHRLIENMVKLIAGKNLSLMSKIEVTTKKSLREKILTYLTQQAEKSESEYFELPMGRVELADYLCANRSALTRELNKMKDDNIIDFDKNVFRIR